MAAGIPDTARQVSRIIANKKKRETEHITVDGRGVFKRLERSRRGGEKARQREAPPCFTGVREACIGSKITNNQYRAISRENPSIFIRIQEYIPLAGGL
jgi:hypothetical protein